MNEPKPRLSTEGQIYVTLAAAEQYLAQAGSLEGIESARRELTTLMLDAYRTDGDPDCCRYRNSSRGIDLTARVSKEGRLIVVISAHVRDFNVGVGDRAAKQRRRIVRQG
jgi:hypothetical protein